MHPVVFVFQTGNYFILFRFHKFIIFESDFASAYKAACFIFRPLCCLIYSTVKENGLKMTV